MYYATEEIILEESAFDLERDYQIFVEGSKKWIKKAEQKSGVKLGKEKRKQIRKYADKIKNSPNYGLYKGDKEHPEEAPYDPRKDAAKSFIKSQVYNQSSDPKFVEKGKKHAQKYGEAHRRMKQAEEENNNKSELRGNLVKQNVDALIDAQKSGNLKKAKEAFKNLKKNVIKGTNHWGKTLASISN